MAIEFIESWINQDFGGKNYKLHVMVRDDDRVCHVNLHGFESIGQALQREQIIVNAIYRHQTVKDFLLLEGAKQ